ncbi:hypothetical protein PVAG01_01435 [Phlyctema vagabunda]|uniref:Ilp is an apoptosis inhibitor n=1 Tax=Phlyctema vagabunda TaxID=108571 RepID=A0ABR4PYJ5_9HELO
MAFNFQAGPSSQPNFQQSSSFNHGNAASASASHARPMPAAPQFDILDWYPQFQSCHRYFLDHAQHSGGVQALAAFMNIKLPYQKQPYPVMSSTNSSPGPGSVASGMRQTPPSPFAAQQNLGHAQSISLIPYIRRLIATGHDRPNILHGFFGDAWKEGIGSLHEVERRNYLFAAKSASWMKVKSAYDMGPEETCPFLIPLRNASEEEMQSADNAWSEWLAMQDWMLGPRSPEMGMNDHEPRIKSERD